jgi:hypothetical protein
LSARTSASAIIAALRTKWENVCDVEAGRLRKDKPGWWERTAETPANMVECESVEHLKATLKTTEEADKILVVGFVHAAVVHYQDGSRPTWNPHALLFESHVNALEKLAVQFLILTAYACVHVPVSG